jgi:hypothetical protein
MQTLIEAYGVSRTRDKKGAIVKQTTLPWVNCIHTNVGGGWKTMEVLILEVYADRELTPAETERI